MYSNIDSSSTSIDTSHDLSSPSVEIPVTECVKFKFKLAILNDIDNKKPQQLKEAADEIKKLLNKKSTDIKSLHMVLTNLIWQMVV